MGTKNGRIGAIGPWFCQTRRNSGEGLEKQDQSFLKEFSKPPTSETEQPSETVQPSQDQIYEFNRFRLSLPNRELSCDGEPVALTPKAFETLVALIERPRRIVSKDELLTLVWPETFVEEATLTQNIYTLRKALAAAGAEGSFIDTIPRRGYRFNQPVTAIAGEFPPQAASATLAPTPSLPTRHTVAVLPFEVLGATEDAELIAVGMADTLITRLSQLSQLIVRPTSAVLRYATATSIATEIGRDLRVEAVLMGTIQNAGPRSRVGVQLVSVADAAPIWAQQFDVASDSDQPDPFALQDSISEQVAEALSLQLTQQEEDRLVRPHTASAEAGRAYVRGRFFWNKRTAQDLEKALTYFQQAVAEDDLYARAHAGLADTYVLLPLYAGRAPRKSFPEAEKAARRALALDDGLAEAHTSLAYSRFVYGWDWPAAEAGFLRALELKPGYATANHWYAFFLAAKGRYGEALVSAQRAVDLDPLSMVINTDLGFVHYFARRPELAIEQLERTLELDPEFPYTRFALGLALREAGRSEEAIEQAGLAVELSQGENTALLACHGHLLARAGRTSEAEEVLARLRTIDRQGEVQAGDFALLLAGMGDIDSALTYLRRAQEERSRFLVFFAVWPIFDRLREEPEFQRILSELNLG